MEKSCYHEIIEELSKKLADKITFEEKNLANRALSIDGDIAEIIQDIGLKTCKRVLETTRDEIVLTKKACEMIIHRNPSILFNSIFGKIEICSPYLWLPGIDSSKPLFDYMKIYNNARSNTVNRALTDFGIEESFVRGAARFKEHYHYDIGPSAVDSATKDMAMKAMDYIENKLSDIDSLQVKTVEKILVEMDGCEIRTAEFVPAEDSRETTPVYNNPKKNKITKWRDVRIGFARPLESSDKTFVGKMDSYETVVNQIHSAAVIVGMTPETKVIGVADGGIGLREELERQFPNMQFILDKTHLKDHLYDTAEALEINRKDRPLWVEPRLRAISDGNVESILREFEEENKKNPNDRLKRLIGYLTRFNDALDYNNYKFKGYPIGSGEIESAHKSIPQKRLKIPGASWNPASIDPMLSLRILRANNWWEDFCHKLADEYLLAAA